MIKIFRDYSSMISEVKLKAWKKLKILTPKQMLQRLLMTLARVKTGNASDNLLSKILQVIHSLY